MSKHTFFGSRCRALRIFLLVYCLCVPAFLGSGHALADFRVSGPAGGGVLNSVSGPPLAPNAVPPFLHFDLREFPDIDGDGDACDVPWALGPSPVPDLDGNGTANQAADRTAATNAFKGGFDAWSAVTPSVLEFVVQPAPAAGCPLTMDGHNLLSWSIAPCNVPGDDVCVPGGGCACRAAVAANADIIRPGPDNWLSTLANSCCDDGYVNIGGGFFQLQDGGNGLIETLPQGDDVMLIAGGVCFGAVAAGAAIIGPGPNGAFNTPSSNCCDDQEYSVGVARRIRDGGDGIITTTNANAGLPPGVLALTAVFYVPSSGVILESDIMFNNRDVTWVIRAQGAAVGGGNNADVQSVAVHEIGHLLGFHHDSNGGNSNPGNPIMNPFAGANANHGIRL